MHHDDFIAHYQLLSTDNMRKLPVKKSDPDFPMTDTVIVFLCVAAIFVSGLRIAGLLS